VNVLDLFSGIGGFSLGLERVGMRTVAFCERDKFCQSVLRKHWPGVPVFDDVTTVAAHRSAEAGGDCVLRGWGVTGERGEAVSSKSSVTVGRTAPAHEIARSHSGVATQRSDGNPQEEAGDVASLSVARGSNYQGSDQGGSRARQNLSDVREPGQGHRPYRSDIKGRANRDEQSPVALPSPPHSEVQAGQKGGINGSLEIVGPIDVICGGFP
jgi:hypothetical protein